MQKELEHIVKKFVPFVDVYYSRGFDEGSRITLPKELIWTLKERQQMPDKGKLILYYRLHEAEIPKIELTDYMEEHFNFPEYKLIWVSSNHRILIPRKDLDKVSIPTQNSGRNSRGVVFEGNGNQVLIYKAEDYERYMTPQSHTT